MQQEKKVLLGMSLDELKAVVKALGMPQFTAGQIAKWLYQQHVTQIDEMTNISKANREKLSVAQNSSRQSISPMAIVPRFVCLVRWAVR